jgi:hypothetical protein
MAPKSVSRTPQANDADWGSSLAASPASSRYFAPELVEIAVEIGLKLVEKATIEDGIDGVNDFLAYVVYAVVKHRSKSRGTKALGSETV